MKKNIIKILFFVVVFEPTLIYAHDIGDDLPISASATAVWYVTCSDDGNGTPTTLEVTVNNATAKAPMLSAQVITNENPPKFFNIADPIGGDKISSAQISTDYGGNHLILLNKFGTGALSYQVTYHCYSDYTQSHTGTDSVNIQ